MPIINIAIVEDDKIVRESMFDFLSEAEGIHCVGCFANAEDFVEQFDKLHPDVVLMDITLPRMSGIQCVSEMKPLRPTVQYLMCTSHNDPEKTFDSLCAGATGYILKNSSPDKLVEAIRDIYNGGSPMSSQIARLVVTSFPGKSKNAELLKSFTQREQDILNDLAKGYQYKEIAQRQFISVETVRTYLRNIYEKLHVHSKIEALNKLFPNNLGSSSQK